MGRVKLSNVAIYGDKLAKEVKKTNSKEYQELAKIVDLRIEKGYRESAEVWIRSKNYVALSSESTKKNKTLIKCM